MSAEEEIRAQNRVIRSYAMGALRVEIREANGELWYDVVDGFARMTLTRCYLERLTKLLLFSLAGEAKARSIERKVEKVSAGK